MSIDTHQLLMFIVAGWLLNLTPGPDVLYIVSNALRSGTRAGIVAGLGITAGCFVHIFAAAVGVGALLAASATAFTVLKWLGAAYLLWMGVRMLFSRAGGGNGAAIAAAQAAPRQQASLRAVFLGGFWTNVLNPKVAVFFLSFLPQFVNPHSEHLQAQIAFLGLWFDIQGTLTLILVALLTGYFRELLNRSPVFWRWQNRVTGAILLWLGVRVAIYD